MIQRGYDQPELGEGAHQVPDAGALETVFRDQGQTGGKNNVSPPPQGDSYSLAYSAGKRKGSEPHFHAIFV